GAARLTGGGLARSAWPLPGLVPGGAPPLAVGDAAGKALASAWLAGEAKRRWAAGAVALLLSCLAVVAGLGAWRLSFGGATTVPAPPFRIDRVGAFAVSPKGDQIAVWKDGAVRLFEVPSGRERA